MCSGVLTLLKTPHPVIRQNKRGEGDAPVHYVPRNRLSQVFYTNRYATVKLSSMNAIHVKQQHNVGIFIFKFTLKYMLGNVKTARKERFFQWSNFQSIAIYYYVNKIVLFQLIK